MKKKSVTKEEFKSLPFYKKPFFRFVQHFTSIDEAYKERPRKWIYNLILFLVIVGAILYFSFDINFFDAFRNPNWSKLANLNYGFVHPNWDYMFGLGLFRFQDSVVYKVIETFAIAMIGTVFASILAIPFGFFASRKIVRKWAYISEALLILIRTFPELLVGYIFIQVFGFGAITGVAVLSITSIGMIGKMYAEQLDAISDEPLEALDAVGATGLTKIKLGVVPQVAPNFLSVILYRFDLNIRTASLLGLVGAGGVGSDIQTYSGNEHWSELASVLYGIIILVILVDIVSAQIRKKLI